MQPFGGTISVQRTISLGTSMRTPTSLLRTSSVSTPKAVLRALGGEAAAATRMSAEKGASLDSSVDLHFRLYKYDSGSMSRVTVPENSVAKAISKDQAAWEMMLSPKASAAERDSAAANLLDLSTAGMTVDPETPRRMQRHYSGVYFLQPAQLDQAGKSRFAPPPKTYQTEARGETGTESYRLFLTDGATDVSGWHDIPLRNEDGTLNFVCEIPKDTTAKMEVATGEEHNPIKQDIKKGKLRFYPYAINWNYGMLPQTWEDPEHKNDQCGGICGDNDPVDVVEIGSTQLQTGGVYKVKPLGAYAMIDDGELDWKIICIRADDPKADSINDIEDVEREMPGELEKIMVWFRDYKIPDGKPPNAYAFDSKPLNSEFANMVIEETHDLYMSLKKGDTANNGNLALA